MTNGRHAQAGAMPDREWRENWQVVPPALAGVMLCAVHGYSLGVMVIPLEHAFGWSRAAITAGPFIISLIALWAAPLTGMAADRFGPRRMALIGVTLFCAALALLSTASANVLTWWLLWAVLGLASMFILPTVWTAAINSRFTRHRGMALATALCGTGVAAAIMPLLTQTLVAHQGWRLAYVSLGAICFVVVFPLVLLSFRSAQEVTRTHLPVQRLSGAAFREALRSPVFVRLAAGMVLFSVAICALTTNGVPMLMGRGFSAIQAAELAGLIGIGSITGRLGAGYLLDLIDARKVAAGCVVAPIAGALLLLAVPGSSGVAKIACLLIGLAAGAEYDATAYLASRHFGLRKYGTMFGALMGLLLFANGVAPLAANAIYDLTGSYDITLWSQVPLCLAAALLFLALGPYPDSVDADPMLVADAATPAAV